MFFVINSVGILIMLTVKDALDRNVATFSFVEKRMFKKSLVARFTKK